MISADLNTTQKGNYLEGEETKHRMAKILVRFTSEKELIVRICKELSAVAVKESCKTASRLQRTFLKGRQTGGQQVLKDNIQG